MKYLVSCLMLLMSCTWAFAQNIDPDSIFRKGEVFYRNGDHLEAIAEFNKVIELQPENINAYLQRGFCRNLTKDYEGAILDFTKVISLKQDHKWAYLSRGSALNKVGKYQLAIDDFNKALELDPTDQEAYNNRGFAKKLSGDKNGACEDWNKSKKLGNDEAKIILKNNNCK